MTSERSRPPALPADAAPVRHIESPLVTFGVVLMVVAVLYVGRDIFVPFALAILLAFVLAPIVIRLRRWGLARVPAVLGVVVLAFAAIGAVGTMISVQLVDLIDNLPVYEQNLHDKIDALRAAASPGGLIDRAWTMVQDLSSEIAATSQGAPPARPGASVSGGEAVHPVPVEIHERAESPVELIGRLLTPVIGPLATAGIVLVFVIFMLFEREDIRDRLIRLVGARDLNRTTQALNDAGARVSRYLFVQLLLNTAYGIAVALGLFGIGVPNPVLWGLLAMLLRFVPYIGPVIGAMMPVALALAADPGWTVPLLVVALFLVLEPVTGNILEPWLYGGSTGISPTAILLAAVFWTWLWGPIGLFLATPMTVCLVVLGHHVPQLQFLDVILGNRPVLSAEAKFYQRMLAGDPEEAIDLAEEFLKQRSIDQLYDDVVLGSLRLAAADRQRGMLDDERLRLVGLHMAEVIEQIGEDAAPAAAGDERAAGGETALPEAAGSGFRVLCLSAGRSPLDQVATAMLAQLLERRGIEVNAPAAAVALTGPTVPADLDSADVVCLSFMHPSAMLSARNQCRRLRRRVPHTRLIAGLWNMQVDLARRGEAETAIMADRIALSLAEAVAEIETQARAALARRPDPIPEPDPATSRDGTPPAPAFASASPAGLVEAPPGRMTPTIAPEPAAS